MPALPNPRHELYAQLFFAGLSEGRTQAQAYIAAYVPSNPNSAHAAASRAMTGRNRRLSVVNRVKELMAESNERVAKRVDVSRERVGRDLDEAIAIAKSQRNAQGMVSGALGIAKVFGLEQAAEGEAKALDARASSRDNTVKVLRSMGLREPDDVSVAAAIEAQDQFVSQLEHIVTQANATIDA